jgi:hypothetical protein
VEFYLQRNANSVEPRSTLNDCRCHCTKHESKQRHLMTVIGAIPTELGKPISQHHGLMLIRRNNCNGNVDHERSKSRTSICTHTYTAVTVSPTRHTKQQLTQGTGNTTSADIKAFSTADSRCCYFCKCSTNCQQQVSCKIRRAAEGRVRPPPPPPGRAGQKALP